MAGELESLWNLIEEHEERESNNSIDYNEILHNARCAERMKAWEKLLYGCLYDL